jgi:hypothetical protein
MRRGTDNMTDLAGLYLECVERVLVYVSKV